MSEKNSSRWRQTGKSFGEIFGWCILLVIVYGILREVLSAPFVFDDIPNIVQNRSIRYLLHPRIFFENLTARMRPLTSASYAWNYWRAGLTLSEFRHTNIFLHFLNATLLWIWLRKIHPWAWWGAVLFLVHPIAADTSIYLTARSSLLCLCFIWLALLSALKPTFGRWLLYLLFSVAAFLSREVAMMIPALLLLQIKMRRQSLSEINGYLWPWIFGGLVFLFQKWNFVDHVWASTFRVHDSVNILNIGEFFRLQVSLWPKALWQFVRPWNQALDPALVLPPSWLSVTVLGSLAVVLLTWIFSTFAFTRKLNFFFCGIAWISFSLLPTNSFFPNLDPFGERHFYFALPGLAILFCAVLSLVKEKISGFVAVGMGVVVLCGALFSFQNRVPKWSTAVSIWGDSYEKYPDKFRVMFNLADAWIIEGGKSDKALTLYLNFINGNGLDNVPFEQMEFFLRALQLAFAQTTKSDQISSVLKSSLKPGFWREYLSLIVDPQRKEEQSWQTIWNNAFAQYQDTYVSRTAPHLYRDLLWLLAADRAIDQKNFPLALKLGVNVISQFKEEQFPYWTWREKYGDILMQMHLEDAALVEYKRTEFRYMVYKLYSGSLIRKLRQLYLKKSDWKNTIEVLGDLVRVETDEADVRKQYAAALRKAGNLHALRHEYEALFYEKFAVRIDDDREIIKP